MCGGGGGVRRGEAFTLQTFLTFCQKNGGENMDFSTLVVIGQIQNFQFSSQTIYHQKLQDFVSH